MNGVVTAKVISEKPDELGRVELEYQGISEQPPKSRPARIAVPMAGPERGFQFLPEKGDEVLVAFKNGDENFPFVIGFLWNGNQKPPRQEAAQRTIKTVSGHVLEFNDKEGEEKISLLFKGKKPSIVLEEKKIEIKIDDNNFIEISSTGISVKGSNVTIEGNVIDLNP